MRTRTLVLALAAGAATFLVVTAAVSEALLPVIEFSVLVGLPAGVVAGVLSAAVVLLWAGEGSDPGRRRAATAFGAFGAAFVTGWFLDLGGVASLIAGSVCGVVVGVGSYFYLRAHGREPAETPT